MDPRDDFVTIEGLEIHVSRWGDPADPPVLCVHGLSRVGRDFDRLARRLGFDFHVLCPDLPGRGWSEWAGDPVAYGPAALADRLVGLCAEFGLENIRWIGTSLGGALGIALAGGRLADRITHLVVNDVSPDPAGDVDPEAIERIRRYVSSPPTVRRISEMESYYRDLYGEDSDTRTAEEWATFTLSASRRTDDGAITRAYDPRIVAALDVESHPDADRPVDPWAAWAAIEADILILHATNSAILTNTELETMLEQQPGARLVEVPGDHPPSLTRPAELDPIDDFVRD